MDPLETLLRPVARVLNRNISELTTARKLCAELDGTIAAIRVRDTALSMYFHVLGDSVELSATPAGEPDVVITGSLLALARSASGSAQAAIRDGALELSGDAEKAEAFQKLLACARPDAEEEIARLLGDPAANSIGRIARRATRWARDARRTMSENIGEYLQEESRDVPTRYEVDRFTADVGTLRDDVERLAVRIDRLTRGT